MPVFSATPGGWAIDAGEVLHLRASSRTWPRPTYQWKLGGVAIAGANRPGLHLPRTDFSDGGRYTVTITNELGSADSQPAPVFVRNGFRFDSRDAAGISRLRLPTVDGRQYELERNAGLAKGDWSVFESFTGDGTVREISDAAAGVPARFYRARVRRDDLTGE